MFLERSEKLQALEKISWAPHRPIAPCLINAAPAPAPFPEHHWQTAPLDASRDAQFLAQQSLATAVHQALEGVQTLPEGGEEGVVAEHAEGRQSAVAGTAACLGPAFSPRRLVHIRGGFSAGRLQGRAALRALSADLF